MSDNSDEIKNLYAIDLLMNTVDKRKKAIAKEDDTQVKTNMFVDDFRGMMRNRVDAFHPSNTLNDSIDHYLYGLWLHYINGDKKCSSPK